ncbi:PQQ-dependent sugar dehydrogenase [Candidatus Microgenomates bacterium]|nr:PQQ-dependent sugar dehydrogenase [Candidatus Microgenomates bacterium]
MKALIIIAVLIGLAGILFWYGQKNTQRSAVFLAKPEIKSEAATTETILENLEIPWEIAFLPTGEMLITQRPGKLIKVGSQKEIIEVEGVAHIGEGGLLGMALDPAFADNNFVYLYLTGKNGSQFSNRVERYKLYGSKLVERKIIVEGILGSSIHDGGRIAFGPDGYLYIATGDAGNSSLAQDKNSLNGKILRVRNDGTGLEIYSMGHRNVQGLAWDSNGRLWATEHGRSGIQSGLDELNLIEKGRNYGWPVIQDSEKKEGMEMPVIHSADDTWAPSGMTYVNGSLFFAGLRGEALYEYKIKEGKLVEYFKNQFGRLRTVVLGPDGFLYLLTNNTDGRGTPKEGDDKIIKVKIP